MKRTLLPLAATLLLLLSLPSSPDAKSATPTLMRSIAGLQWVTVTPDGRPVMGVHCSVSLINAQLHYWLTAAHCVADDSSHEPGVADRDFFIDGKEAVVVAVMFENDLAIMQTEKSNGPALKFSNSAPVMLDPIQMAGYPYGLGPTISIGHVMNPAMRVGSGVYMTYSITGCPGNSGSAVVNAKNEVVSVIQVGIGASQGGCAGFMGGATYAQLRAFAYPYFVEGKS